MGDTLFFAGDTTVATEGVGSIAGAFASGERVAGEVALSLNLELQAPDANQPILDLL